MKKVEIPLVPTENIPHPWGKAIEIAKKITLPPEAAISKAYAALYKYAQANWECSFHWLYKLKWKHKHKIPSFGDVCTEVSEPVGWLLWSLLELCEEVHRRHCVETKNYNHASDRFPLICQEILCRYFFDEKSQGLQKLRKDLKALKNSEEEFQNPYSTEENLHLHRLATVCRKLATDWEFERTYLRSRGMKIGRHPTPPGFIQALSTWATELDQNPEIVTYRVEEFSTGNKATRYKLFRYYKKAKLSTPLEIPQENQQKKSKKSKKKKPETFRR